MAGWHHDKANWVPKKCVVCDTIFTPKSGVHKFCSEPCKGKWKYITGFGSTENQYKEINGNWKRYLSRLLYVEGRKRENLTQEILLNLVEKQNYKCAISGEPLTCYLIKGKQIFTNASVDQIIPNGGYTIDNIQLVQKRYNLFKLNMSQEEYIEACRKVVEYHDKKKTRLST